MNSIEIAKILKKHARYGSGLFAITIDEHDPDYKAVIEWMEQDAYTKLSELEKSRDVVAPIIETIPAASLPPTREELEDFWYDR